MPETKIKLKNKLISLINSLDYLSQAQKEDWFKICENSNDEQIKNLYKNFADEKADEDNFKLSLIYKTSLGDLYKSKIREISNKYLSSARKKSEAYSVQTEEKPEDILSKLNDV